MRSRLPARLLFNAVSRCPDLSLTLLRGLYRKHIGTNREYRRGTGEALEAPRQISLRITNACNHRCAVCGQYGSQGYMKDPEHRDMLKTLPVETYKDLVDQVAGNHPIFYVTGGEPFLYPGFMELMKYIKSKGCVLSVVTNGVMLEKYAEEIVADQWDMLLVSFDGPKEIHDRCRNFPGAYVTAVNGLKKIREIKEAARRVKPFVLTSTTISRVNAPVLEDTFRIGSELSPDLMVVYLSWFTSEAIGHAHSAILEEHLGITPFTWKSYATEFSDEDARMFHEALTRVKKRKWPFEYLVIPDLKDKDFARYYTDPGEMFGFDRCAAPFLMIDVMPNGDVTTCRDFIDVKVGNITEKPLLEIWNDEPFVRFRKLLLDRGGLLPQCSRCCGLMGF
jgi:radical SAM protein with 4Fe4S-binding SPASM domain